MKKYMSAIVFWGALWGLEEATLGHLLHITTLNIGWVLWFPLAYFFMAMVYKQTGKINAILITSVVAAVIKLTNLFMTPHPLLVLCPALSIILEGISLFVVLKLFNGKKQFVRLPLLRTGLVSVLWRISYAIVILAIPVSIMSSYPYKTIGMLFKFIFFEGIVNSLLAVGIGVVAKRIKEIYINNHTSIKRFMEEISHRIKGICFRPLFSLSLLAVAILIQVFL